ncbi:MAG: hypothetical protein QXO15_07060 [Nitrososphaerota archaeon]
MTRERALAGSTVETSIEITLVISLLVRGRMIRTSRRRIMDVEIVAR